MYEVLTYIPCDEAHIPYALPSATPYGRHSMHITSNILPSAIHHTMSVAASHQTPHAHIQISPQSPKMEFSKPVSKKGCGVSDSNSDRPHQLILIRKIFARPWPAQIAQRETDYTWLKMYVHDPRTRALYLESNEPSNVD